MSKIPVILIFDIGKTNKKLLLINEYYKVLIEENVQLKEAMDEDDFPCENIETLTSWILDSYQRWIKSDAYEIKAVNFSAYGASFVLLDENKQSFLPLYNYLKPFQNELQQTLYQQHGGEEQFALETSSPVLGSLNAGLQLYRLSKLRPAEFQKLKYALHLPQYLSYLISHKMGSDITSIGCHTALWDFKRNRYHDWVFQEGIAEKLQPIESVDACTINAESNISIGIGLHDSSAALIPYLKTINERFILISTGTWCISLNPFNQHTLTASELKQDCLFYYSYEGKPVKASRLFAGYEHDIQVKRLSEYFHVALDHHKSVKYRKEIIEKLHLNHEEVKEDFSPRCFIFSSRNLQDYKDFDEAYHQLMLDIVSMQVKSTKLIIQDSSMQSIYVDGGFSSNQIYMQLLSNYFSSYKVYAAAVPQASAIGAAVAMHQQWNHHSIPSHLVECTQIHPL
ncbi:MAG: FGGY-family carbohydrate kinase [Bacteroidota bacterium]|jgi:sugar (pentulose or hexulose) kinase